MPGRAAETLLDATLDPSYVTEKKGWAGWANHFPGPRLPIVRGDVEEDLGSLVGFTIRRLSRRRASSNRLPVGQLLNFQGPAIHRPKERAIHIH